MKRVFSNYEQLKCDVCGSEFKGRRPAGDGPVLCPEHLVVHKLSLMENELEIPNSVFSEIKGGKG